ncbi:MAG: hypothetical protein AAF636_19290 [Pseudomonadota bacterium]
MFQTSAPHLGELPLDWALMAATGMTLKNRLASPLGANTATTHEFFAGTTMNDWRQMGRTTVAAERAAPMFK